MVYSIGHYVVYYERDVGSDDDVFFLEPDQKRVVDSGISPARNRIEAIKDIKNRYKFWANNGRVLSVVWRGDPEDE